MGYIGKSHTFSPSTDAKSSEVNTNFDDLVSGLSDGTKDVKVANVEAVTKTKTSTLQATSGAAENKVLVSDGSGNLSYGIGTWVPAVGYKSVGTGGDYATITLAVAGGATHIKLVSDVTVTAEQDFTLSDGVIDGQGFALISSASISGSILKISGSRNVVKDLIIEGQHASGTITDLVEISGEKNNIDCRVNQNDTGGTADNSLMKISGDYNYYGKVRLTNYATSGTVVNGLEITSDLNRVDGLVIIDGTGGTITNGLNVSGDYNQCLFDVKAVNGTITNNRVNSGTFNFVKTLLTVDLQDSVSSGNYSTTNTSDTDVDNLSVTVVSSGRPIMVVLQPDGSTNAYLGANGTSQKKLGIYLKIWRSFNGGAWAEISKSTIHFDGSSALDYTDEFYVTPSMSHIDDASAGENAYKVTVASIWGTESAHVSYLKLLAYEL